MAADITSTSARWLIRRQQFLRQDRRTAEFRNDKTAAVAQQSLDADFLERAPDFIEAWTRL